mmetsp:Transcript_23904/g.42137  ORF Transcript_23904/g.42137 Transcript_23904/m.42137 type:complete len:213 (-) Transcript_23904:973-1611(-)
MRGLFLKLPLFFPSTLCTIRGNTPRCSNQLTRFRGGIVRTLETQHRITSCWTRGAQTPCPISTTGAANALAGHTIVSDVFNKRMALITASILAAATFLVNHRVPKRLQLRVEFHNRLEILMCTIRAIQAHSTNFNAFFNGSPKFTGIEGKYHFYALISPLLFILRGPAFLQQICNCSVETPCYSPTTMLNIGSYDNALASTGSNTADNFTKA